MPCVKVENKDEIEILSDELSDLTEFFSKRALSSFPIIIDFSDNGYAWIGIKQLKDLGMEDKYKHWIDNAISVQNYLEE